MSQFGNYKVKIKDLFKKTMSTIRDNSTNVQALVEVEKPKPFKTTQTIVDEMQVAKYEEQIKNGYRNQHDIDEKARIKKMSYAERREKGHVKQPLNK